jgi:hypothetical protein
MVEGELGPVCDGRITMSLCGACARLMLGQLPFADGA